MSSQHWQTRCAERKRKQQSSIPPAWLLDHLPTHPTANVLDFPATCGLLTPLELEITNTINVDILLAKLSTGQWSSVAVTTAFYKRAIIAHQLVSCLILTTVPLFPSLTSYSPPPTRFLIDELSHGDFHRPGSRKSQTTRSLSIHKRQSHRSAPWSSHLTQRPVLHQRARNNHGSVYFPPWSLLPDAR